MSSESTTPAKQYFYVLARDYPGTWEIRKSVKESHKVVAQKQIADGVIVFGGGLLTEDSIKPGAEFKQSIGSTMVYYLESIEKVRELIESDVYWKSGVWDKENIIITPFLPAVKQVNLG